MKSNKKQVTMRVDKDLWEIAKVILPCSRSEFFEKCLRSYINSSDEIKELEKEIKDLEQQTLTKKEKLNDLKEIRETNSKNEAKINEALKTCRNIYYNNGIVTIEQINYIANNKDIFKDVLVNKCEKEGIKILK